MTEKSDKKILRMEELLNKSGETETKHEQPELKPEQPNKLTESKKKNKPKVEPPAVRGKPKSGRIWKSPKTKFSSIIKTKGIRNSFERKEALRKELARTKEISRALVAAKQEEKELRKERRRENLKRQEENRKKSEVVQVIKNTAKIKRMKKKQLRYIEKRDTLDV